MKLDEQFMQNAIIRINELQKDMIEKSKHIKGAQQYIQKRLELYEKDEELRNRAKSIYLEEQKMADEFFARNTKAIEGAEKLIDEAEKASQAMIREAARVSQDIEGYASAARGTQDTVREISKKYNKSSKKSDEE